VLDDRYGAPSRARRPVVIGVVAVLVVAATAWLVWVIGFHGRPEVSSQMVGYGVAGQHSATARFSVVRRSTDVTAQCVLTAYASDHAVVGEVTVPVGARYSADAIVRSTMRTERRATTVELVGCTAPGQDKPR